MLLNFDGNTQRISKIPKDYNDLQNIVSKTYKNISNRMSYRFKDSENELVSINSQEEYQLMTTISQKTELILYISQSKQNSIPNQIENIQVQGSLNLDYETSVKSKSVRFPCNFKETSSELDQMPLMKRESSSHLNSPSPYSEIPCLKCRGTGKKADKACGKCDASGKMKNSQKLKVIDYLLERKLQALSKEVLSMNWTNKIEEKINKVSINKEHMESINKFIHQGYQCDGCKIKPIIGNRFHCTICDNFDFCENCESEFGKEHLHPLLKIKGNLNISFDKNFRENLANSLIIVDNKEYKAEIKLSKDNKVEAECQQPLQIKLVLKNIGELKWPDNMEFKCIGGLYEKISEGIPSLEKDGIYTVILNLEAPSKVGEFESVWKLGYRIKNDLIFFGPRISFNLKINEKYLIKEKYEIKEKAMKLKQKFENFKNNKKSLPNNYYLDLVKKYEFYTIDELFEKLIN